MLVFGNARIVAQGEDLSVKGRVVDEAGAMLVGVEITAKRISYNTKGYVASLANDPLLKNRVWQTRCVCCPVLTWRRARFRLSERR